MTTVTETVQSSAGKPVVICDVSPPRGGAPGALRESAALDADFLSVAHNPGLSVRVNSVFAARYVLECLGKPALFTLATRDMNRIAIQSLLLGASWTGLHNVVVVRGDPIGVRDSDLVKSVNDYTTTALLSDISRMNQSRDFRGLSLSSPTSFCPGATVDIGKGIESEASLASRKIMAGAEFLLSQAHFDAPEVRDLRSRISTRSFQEFPVFAGVQVLAQDGIDFGNIPDGIRQDLDEGKSGLEIAKELALDLWSEGISTFYVIPTIRRRGIRDYSTAAELIQYIKSLPVSYPASNR